MAEVAELARGDVGRSGPLAEFTTFRVGGPARQLLVGASEADLVAAVVAADEAGEQLLVLGGGSNVLIADQGFAGTVLRVATSGVQAEASDCAGATVRVAAGESWDELVAYAIGQQWIGIETMAGIPGSVGATPIQNVGAYGCEVSQTIASVKTFDRHTRRQATFAAAECGFGYRSSRFKSEPDRHLVLEVTFQFRLGTLSAPIRYPELARTLGVGIGERAPIHEVRQAVLALRAGKGMVLDESDHDTWSAGSFFTNPILTPEAAAELPPGAPRFVQPDGRFKTSAAWLIEHSGFRRGFGAEVGAGQARLSNKHALALTNRGQATAAELLELARLIQTGVRDEFGVTLEPEPVLVGCSL